VLLSEPRLTEGTATILLLHTSLVPGMLRPIQWNFKSRSSRDLQFFANWAKSIVWMAKGAYSHSSAALRVAVPVCKLHESATARFQFSFFDLQQGDCEYYLFDTLRYRT
jgi:hypothetical protein